MKLRYRILIGVMLLTGLAITALAFIISHDSACPPPPAVTADKEHMEAVRYYCYGSADVLEYADVEKPVPGDGELLIKIETAAVNPLDWHYMRGTPYLMRLMSGTGAPKDNALGVDFAGTVVGTGNGVTRFQPGDRVFGGRAGAFAEYLAIGEEGALAAIPDEVNFEQAASLPVAASTALQALRDVGKLRPGEKVLINGASGGVGTFAVQIAKAMGAEVTGVCSTRNVEMVRALGADHVFDYKRENYTESGEQYDVIIDNVGNHSLLANRKVLTPNGRFVIVGGSSGDWLGPLMRPIGAMLISPFVDPEYRMILARLKREDLEYLAELMREGKIKGVIDSRFPLSELPDAIRHSEAGRARGKIVINSVGE